MRAAVAKEMITVSVYLDLATVLRLDREAHEQQLTQAATHRVSRGEIVRQAIRAFIAVADGQVTTRHRARPAPVATPAA